MAPSKSALQSTPGIRPSVLIPYLITLMENREPFLLRGSPGIGKTDIICLAASMAKNGSKGKSPLGMEVHVAHPVVSDPTDFKGMPAVVSGEAHFLPYGDLKALLEAKSPLLFFLDDLGQAPGAVQAACMQLLLSRSINGHKISDFVTFAAATNNKSDKAGVTGILEPVKSRFTTILGVSVNVDDWIKWAVGKGADGEQRMPDSLIAYIKWKPDALSNFQPTAEIVNTPSPRTIAALGRLVKMGFHGSSSKRGFDGRLALYEGAVGAGVAGEFLAFQEVYMNMMDPDLILADPSRLKVDHEKMDVNYAMVIALASRVTTKTIANYMTAVNKYRKDMEVISITHAMTVKPELQETREFRNWVIKNQNVWTQ